MDAGGAADESALHARRVVLTSRRWRQVSRRQLRKMTGDKKARSPGSTYKPLKPLRRECRIASAEPVCSCAFFLCSFAHETAGAACTRYSLRPVVGGQGNFWHGPDASRRGTVNVYLKCHHIVVPTRDCGPIPLPPPTQDIDAPSGSSRGNALVFYPTG